MIRYIIGRTPWTAKMIRYAVGGTSFSFSVPKAIVKEVIHAADVLDQRLCERSRMIDRPFTKFSDYFVGDTVIYKEKPLTVIDVKESGVTVSGLKESNKKILISDIKEITFHSRDQSLNSLLAAICIIDVLCSNLGYTFSKKHIVKMASVYTSMIVDDLSGEDIYEIYLGTKKELKRVVKNLIVLEED